MTTNTSLRLNEIQHSSLSAHMERSALRWFSGAVIGLLGAATGVVVLLVAGYLSGRGAGLITDAGAGLLPAALAGRTDLSPAAAYLVVHATFYLAAGLAAVIFARVADRFPPVMAGFVYIILVVEVGFLFFSTETLAQHRIDELTWRAFLVAHGVADLIFLLLLILAHPDFLRDMRESDSYEG